MEITISGRHVTVNKGVREHARKKLERLERYFDRVGRIRVRFEAPGSKPSVSVVVPIVRGGTLVAEADGADYLEAVDSVVRRLERQLKRYKAKLRGGRQLRAKG